jgi:hypothetical protein
MTTGSCCLRMATLAEFLWHENDRKSVFWDQHSRRLPARVRAGALDMSYEWMVSSVVRVAVWIFEFVRGQPRVSFKTHRAVLEGVGECYFFTVTNRSRSRDIVLTHVWVQSRPEVHIIQPARPLPRRLSPEEPWETWVPVSALPADAREDAYTLGRVKLSSGKVLTSIRDLHVPAVGFVPGGEA